MSAEGTIIIDLFEGACLQYLNSSEMRLLMFYTGINTGFPPMGFYEIGTRIGRSAAIAQKAVLRSLLKLPLRTIEDLKRYVDDKHHRFHQSLTHPQRYALTKLLHLGVATHRLNRPTGTDQSLVAKSKPSSPSTQPLPWTKDVSKPIDLPISTLDTAKAQAVMASVPRVSSNERLCAALGEIGRPSHYVTIRAYAERSGLSTTPAKAQELLKNSSQVVALSRTVFALTCWHNRAPDAPSHVLYCPPLPISVRVPAAALFELVVVTQKWLGESHYSYRDVWDKTTKHTGLEDYEAPNLFDLWYALGLCDSIDYVGQRREVMRPAWSQGTPVTLIRRQVLDTLMQRMVLMPQTLAALADLATTEPEALSTAVYGNALDGADISARVRLLEGLGAISSDGVLTPLGDEMRRAYPVSTKAQSPSTMGISVASDEDVGWLDL